jgi:phosphoglycolate phosphatase-like HAD superfamily hydrolase
MAIDCNVNGDYFRIMNGARFNSLKLAFFDIDGTLIRRNNDGKLGLKSRAFNYGVERAFGLKGFDYTKILGKRIYGLTDRSIIKVTLHQLGIGEKQYHSREALLFDAIDEYFEENVGLTKRSEYYPVPGIFAFLEILRSNGVRLGLVTGNIKKHADWKMSLCGFDGIFTTGGFGDDAELRSDIMRAGMGRNPDIPPENICHFGDSPPDILAAMECGIKAVAISTAGGGTHTRAELEEAKYGLIIDSWSEVELISQYLA